MKLYDDQFFSSNLSISFLLNKVDNLIIVPCFLIINFLLKSWITHFPILLQSFHFLDLFDQD